MSSDLYVALSGQITMQERLTTLANNVANIRTNGFRAETVHFDSIFSAARRQSTAFATTGGTHIQRHSGPIEKTDNALDVAIVGDGWFGVQTPAGIAYTRDGRFTVSEAGDLLTSTGYNVLDEGGAGIAIELARGPIEVAGDGRITQGGGFVGNLGLFAIPNEANLSRYGDSIVLADRPAEPVVDRLANGFRQGFREGSNVNAMEAIADLIVIQRAFEYAQSAIDDRYQTLQQSVRTLGAE